MVVEVEEEGEEGYMPSLEKDDISSMIEHAMKNEDGEDIVDIREAWDDSLHVVPPLSREGEASLPAHNDQQQEEQHDEEDDILLDMILESNLLDDVEDKTSPTFAGFDKGFLLQRPRAPVVVVKEKEMKKPPQERPRVVVVKENEVRPSSLKQTDGLERKPLSKFKQSRMKSIPSS